VAVAITLGGYLTRKLTKIVYDMFYTYRFDK